MEPLDTNFRENTRLTRSEKPGPMHRGLYCTHKTAASLPLDRAELPRYVQDKTRRNVRACSERSKQSAASLMHASAGDACTGFQSLTAYHTGESNGVDQWHCAAAQYSKDSCHTCWPSFGYAQRTGSTAFRTDDRQTRSLAGTKVSAKEASRDIGGPRYLNPGTFAQRIQ